MRFIAKLLLAWFVAVAVAAAPLAVIAAPLGVDVAVLNGPPCAFPGSALDLNFQLNAATLNCHQAGLATGQLTLTRTTVGYAQYNSGIWQQFPSGAFRVTDKGLLVEEARTNDALWSRDMTNAAWVKGATMTAALTQTGIDGTPNSATLLTGGATSATNTVLQTITLGSQADTYDVFLKRVTGTGTVNITIDNGVTWTPETLTTAYQQFQVQKTAANPVFGIQITTNGDQVAADFNQLEPGGFATSPILTTTVAATRNADQVVLANNGSINFVAGTWYAEWREGIGINTGVERRLVSQRVDGANLINLFSGTSASGKAAIAISATAKATTSLITTNLPALGTAYRMAVAYAASDTAFAASASLLASVTTASTDSLPTGVFVIGIGGNPTATNAQTNSYLRHIVQFPFRQSNAQIQAYAQGTIGP